jgi:hypothetical protein
MLWFLILISFSLSVVFGGPTAGKNAATVMFYLLILLGMLQVLVTTIELIQYIAIIYGV